MNRCSFFFRFSGFAFNHTFARCSSSSIGITGYAFRHSSRFPFTGASKNSSILEKYASSVSGAEVRGVSSQALPQEEVDLDLYERPGQERQGQERQGQEHPFFSHSALPAVPVFDAVCIFFECCLHSARFCSFLDKPADPASAFPYPTESGLSRGPSRIARPRGTPKAANPASRESPQEVRFVRTQDSLGAQAAQSRRRRSWMVLTKDPFSPAQRAPISMSMASIPVKVPFDRYFRVQAHRVTRRRSGSPRSLWSLTTLGGLESQSRAGYRSSRPPLGAAMPGVARRSAGSPGGSPGGNPDQHLSPGIEETLVVRILGS